MVTLYVQFNFLTKTRIFCTIYTYILYTKYQTHEILVIINVQVTWASITNTFALLFNLFLVFPRLLDEHEYEWPVNLVTIQIIYFIMSIHDIATVMSFVSIDTRKMKYEWLKNWQQWVHKMYWLLTNTKYPLAKYALHYALYTQKIRLNLQNNIFTHSCFHWALLSCIVARDRERHDIRCI